MLKNRWILPFRHSRLPTCLQHLPAALGLAQAGAGRRQAKAGIQPFAKRDVEMLMLWIPVFRSAGLE